MLRAVESSFVTIMFTDVVGSTTLYDRYGDDEADARRARHFAVLREVVATHEGREVKSTGDGLMVTFTSAVAAVRCAVAHAARDHRRGRRPRGAHRHRRRRAAVRGAATSTGRR